MRTIYYALTHADAYCPERAHGTPHSDAGYDLRSCTYAVLLPGETIALDIGVAIELPRDTLFHIWEAQIRPRSSLRRKGIIASFGTIDSGFRGEIGCILHNISKATFTVNPGDKICQLVVTRLPKIRWQQRAMLGISERGCGRYGSTGR